MNINKKSAFTIAELVLTTVIMSVVCIIAPMAILKRDVKPPVKKKLDYIVKCATKCIYDAHSGAILFPKQPSHLATASLDYNKNSNAFYEITLIGGGGGGTRNSIGYPGEEKTIYLPSLDENSGISGTTANADKFEGELTGYYLLEIGGSGVPKKGVGNQNTYATSGGDTKICTLTKDFIDNIPDSLEGVTCDNIIGASLIAVAKGGITSNEKGVEQGSTEPNTKEEYLESNPPTEFYGQGGQGGKGGKKSTSGGKGIILIK